MFLDRAIAAFLRPAWGAPFGSRPRSLLLTPSGARFFGDGEVVDVPSFQDAAADPVAALAACAQLLTSDRGKRIRIVLSDLWIRHCLIPVDAADSLGDAELLALARGQLSRQHPDTSEWPLRVALQGNTLLAIAIRPEAMDGVRALAEQAGVRLTSIEPLFAYLRDNVPNVPEQRDGWLLLEEPGLLMVMFVRAGGIVALHSARLDEDAAIVASRLLDRQAALLGVGAGGDVSLFSGSASPLALPLPWRVGERVRY